MLRRPTDVQLLLVTKGMCLSRIVQSLRPLATGTFARKMDPCTFAMFIFEIRETALQLLIYYFCSREH